LTPSEKNPGEERNFAHAMLAADAARPNARAIFNIAGDDIVLTHSEVVEQARQLASGLQGLGLCKGDILAIQMPTRPATMLAHAAAAWLGLVVLPIIHIYEGAELEFILDQSAAKAILTPASWRNIDFAARRKALALRYPELIQIVEGDGGTGTHAIAELMRGPPHPVPAPVEPGDLLMLLYTSGTTSQPKGVQHSHASLLAEMSADTAKRRGLSALSPWPPGHVAGVMGLMRFWAMGQDSAFMEAWDGTVAARLVEQYGIQATSGTPFHITTLLDAAETDNRDLSSLSDFLAGATMIPPALVERCQAMGIALYKSYGLSEHPTVSSGSPTDPLEKRLGTDGRLNAGVEVRIVDDEGHELPQGQAGEILTRGPDLFIGYRDASRNAEAFTPDGWLRTGDVGTLDAEGYLSITDRKKDIIIRGGENIASREVEDLLSLMSGVRESAVVGAPDEKLGERVAAFIVTEPDAVINLDTIAAHFRAQKVARQKTPEIVRIVSELPRNGTGKVLKPSLRTLLKG
jgi:acyl-CoA synthetase (AMP-forming)/AMP-acid ligase II